MKKIYFSFLSFVLVLAMVTPVSGQGRHIKGDKNVVKVTKSLPSFNKIDAGGIDKVILSSSTTGEHFVVIETDQNIQSRIQPSVHNQTLSFTYSNIDPSTLKLYVTYSSDIVAVKASGASTVKSTSPLKGDNLALRLSGASNTKLVLEYRNIEVKNSGAAHAVLTGHCNTVQLNASGASVMNAQDLTVDSLFVDASGASMSKVNATKYLRKKVSGAARVSLVPQHGKELDINTDKKIVSVITYRKDAGTKNAEIQNKVWVVNNKVRKLQHDMGDTTRVDIGSFQVKVMNGDSTRINVGNHMLIVDDRGNVKWGRKSHIRRFNGHWAGVDLGLNGYVTPQFNSNFGTANDYLSLRFDKSLNVHVKFIEQNLPLNKKNTVGLVTGMGLNFNDYRFSNRVLLDNTANNLSGYYIEGASVRKSKLSILYLSVPLLLEFQTKEIKRDQRFFMSFGLIGNVTLRSHSKIYFNDPNQAYLLRDPATGNLLPDVYATPDKRNRNIVKSTGGFYVNPFRVDATIRFGFRMISLFANYALTPMFQSGRGPELHQWSVGISLIDL